jgi:hypothetical protein
MTLTLAHYLTLGAILFAISVIGIFLNRRNVIIVLMAIELMLLAVNLNFVAFSHFLGDAAGRSSCSSSSRWPRPNRRSGWRSWWCCSATSTRSTSRISTSSRVKEGRMKTAYLLAAFAPLVGAIVAGLFGRTIGRAGAHTVTILGVAVRSVASAWTLSDVLAGNTFNGTACTCGR